MGRGLWRACELQHSMMFGAVSTSITCRRRPGGSMYMTSRLPQNCLSSCLTDPLNDPQLPSLPARLWLPASSSPDEPSVGWSSVNWCVMWRPRCVDVCAHVMYLLHARWTSADSLGSCLCEVMLNELAYCDSFSYIYIKTEVFRISGCVGC